MWEVEHIGHWDLQYKAIYYFGDSIIKKPKGIMEKGKSTTYFLQSKLMY